MKSHLPKCTELVVKVEKSDDSTSENKNSLLCIALGATDNYGLCLTRLKVLDSLRYR